MNWLVGLDQAAEPCCPWPGQCDCRPAARRTLRVKVPHQARRPEPREVYRPEPRARRPEPRQAYRPEPQARRPQPRQAYRQAPAYAAPAPAPAFDLNVSGDNWEAVLANLVGQAH